MELLNGFRCRGDAGLACPNFPGDAADAHSYGLLFLLLFQRKILPETTRPGFDLKQTWAINDTYDSHYAPHRPPQRRGPGPRPEQSRVPG